VIALSWHRNLHRLAVTAALLVYALPLAVGAFSQMGHGAFHLLVRLEERQARAAALGLVHLSELAVERPTSSSNFVHTHDGVTHSHAGAVDALLSASEHADEDHDAAAPMVKLSAHTFSTASPLWIALSVGGASRAVDAVAPDHPRPLPPLPPPRG
jgi:hypothetical protein